MKKIKAAVTVLAVMFVVGIAAGWTIFNTVANIVQDTMEANYERD